MPADAGYKEARAISEAAREKDWKLPSFGRGLYLGCFERELISPQLCTERLFDELWDNADAPNHRLALDVLKGRSTWLEEGMIDPSAGYRPMVPSVETDGGTAIPIAAATTNAAVS